MWCRAPNPSNRSLQIESNYSNSEKKQKCDNSKCHSHLTREVKSGSTISHSPISINSLTNSVHPALSPPVRWFSYYWEPKLVTNRLILSFLLSTIVHFHYYSCLIRLSFRWSYLSLWFGSLCRRTPYRPWALQSLALTLDPWWLELKIRLRQQSDMSHWYDAEQYT